MATPNGINSCLSHKSTFSDKSHVIKNKLQLKVNKYYIIETKTHQVLESKVKPPKVLVFEILLNLNVKLLTKASAAEYSAEEPAEYSASRRFSRIFGWCADLAPSGLMQLFQAQLWMRSSAY